MERAAWVCGGSAANLVGIGGPMLLPLNLFTGKMADRASRHFANPSLWGSCNWRVGSSSQPMTIRYDKHYRAYRRQVGGAITANYDDVVSDLDMQFGCQSVLMADQEHFLGLAIMRGKLEGPCDPSAIFAFERIVQHAQRAVRVHLALDGEAGELLVGDWEERGGPMMVLDRFGGLCALTAAGEGMLDEKGPLMLRGISVAARHPRENRMLQGALARLLAIPDDVVGPQIHQMIAGHCQANADGVWRLSLIRLPQRPHGLGFEPHLLIWGRRLAKA